MKRVFISYSWSDRAEAQRIADAVRAAGLEVWIDSENISPGHMISEKIKEGIDGSDYYLVVFSQNAAESAWVRAEIAYSFKLTIEKKTTIIPVLTDAADLPFEFTGYLYIDFRPSFADGLETLKSFFRSQITTLAKLEPRQSIRKTDDAGEARRRACEDALRALELGDLRYRLSERLTQEQVSVIWFDTFHRRIEDEIRVTNVSLSCVELLDRARREDELARLVSVICRNNAKVARA